MDSIWGFASAVGDAVKKSTAEITDTLRNTEWSSEFADIKKEIEEDTSDITSNAKALTSELQKKAQLTMRQANTRTGLLDTDGSPSETMKHAIKVKEKIVHGTNEAYEKLSDVFSKDLGLGGLLPNQKQKAEEDTKLPPGYGRFDAEIQKIQKSATTYNSDPKDEEFISWKKDFCLEDFAEQISKLEAENSHIRKLKREMVPFSVSETIFWCRYFFKMSQVEDRRRMLERLAEGAHHCSDEDDLDWGNDWNDDISGVDDVSPVAETSIVDDAAAAVDDTGIQGSPRLAQGVASQATGTSKSEPNSIDAEKSSAPHSLSDDHTYEKDTNSSPNMENVANKEEGLVPGKKEDNQATASGMQDETNESPAPEASEDDWSTIDDSCEIKIKSNPHGETVREEALESEGSWADDVANWE